MILRVSGSRALCWVVVLHPAGDVVLFPMTLLHGSLTNQSPETMRLSCDVRFQPASDPVDVRYTIQEGGRGAKMLDGRKFDLAERGGERRSMATAREEWGIAPPLAPERAAEAAARL